MNMWGDRTPSEFLRHLQELSVTPFEDNPLLRKLLFSHFPPNVQSILTTMANSNSLDQIATMKYKIIEFTVQPAPHHTSSDPIVASPNTAKSPNLSRDDILERVNTLTHCMDTLWQQYASSHRPRSRSHSKSQSSSSTPTVSNLCWYHATFKGKAH
ncbi:uncharacterized protein LOC115214484 [Octopus sinensis]|uniref:Uncharacterized protein LOC115214484 n=1 Tax=Octopus sinensis TaxID=2607531 RepID=A0A6P7SM94_9MOLL|nr:uncharacterized protein LOC115214484 [Octopus sinensis]